MTVTKEGLGFFFFLNRYFLPHSGLMSLSLLFLDGGNDNNDVPGVLDKIVFSLSHWKI